MFSGKNIGVPSETPSILKGKLAVSFFFALIIVINKLLLKIKSFSMIE
jgi:hypothetical protein